MLKAGCCKHFNGIGLSLRKGDGGDKCCDAGINYRDLVGHTESGWETQLPCNKKFACDPVECDKYEEPTAEEIAADEAWVEARIDMTLKARAAIVQHTGGKRGVSGAIDCPACESGQLRFSVAGCNGHIHAACTTTGCLSWME